MTAGLLLLSVALIAANGFFVGAELAASQPGAADWSRCSAVPAVLGPRCAPSSSFHS